MTWAIVRSLLKQGIPTITSAQPISLSRWRAHSRSAVSRTILSAVMLQFPAKEYGMWNEESKPESQIPFLIPYSPFLVLFVVFVHGRLQSFEEVGERRGDSRPVRDQRRPQRILEELLHGLFDHLRERLDRRALLVPVEDEAVQGRVVRVLLDRVLRHAQVRDAEAADEGVGNHDPLAGERAQERFRDVERHPG